MITAGLCIEASFQRGKGEAGMDEYQVRTWHGWHHHMALSLLAVWFLIGETHRGQSFTPALTLPQVRYGLSLLLLAVLCPLDMDSICRRVQRQLQRNELTRFYHHRTRKCMPTRKSDTPGKAGGLMSRTASKAVGYCERAKNALLHRRLPAPEYRYGLGPIQNRLSRPHTREPRNAPPQNCDLVPRTAGRWQWHFCP